MQTTGLYKTQLEGTLQRNTNSSSKWNKTLNEGPMGPPIKRHNMDTAVYKTDKVTAFNMLLF